VQFLVIGITPFLSHGYVVLEIQAGLRMDNTRCTGKPGGGKEALFPAIS